MIVSKRKKVILVTVAIIGIIGFFASYLAFQNHEIKLSPAESKKFNKLLNINKNHIEKVGTENEVSAIKAIKEVESMFESMRENVPATVGELYSLKSKFKYIGKLIADEWPWSVKKDRLSEMVEGIFEKHLGSDKSLKKKLESIEKNYARSLTANKNNLLLDLEFDVDVDNQNSTEINKENFVKLFDKQLAEFAGPMVGFSLGGEFTSLVVGEVVTIVVINIVTRAGAYVIGGATTLGIGILVGVGIDLIVTKCAKDMMVKKLNVAINEIEKVVLNGTEEYPGLVTRLNQISKNMTQVEEKAVIKSLKIACLDR